MFYGSGCTGKRAACTWWEYTFLFKGRRRAGKLDIILENTYVSSNVVVKLPESFVCLT